MGTITEFIEPLLQGVDLDIEQAGRLLDTVFQGDVPDAQIAAFLTAMQIKGPTAQELAGLAGSLRDHAVPVRTDAANLVDTCGTGGAAVKTFNVSTAAALLAAGAGVHIAKHGNRAITSSCGSADVLAELGVKIDCSPQTVAQCIEKANFGFMFAPMFHPAMKYVQPVRKSLGFRTVFNILGPLANPAGVKAQVLGVADETLMERVAEALSLLGAGRAMVVHCRGLDEIGLAGATKILEITNGQIVSRSLDPSDYGFALSEAALLEPGADAPMCAKIIKDILAGRQSGPRSDIVVLNAAAAIIVAGLADSFEEALRMADSSLKTGAAFACLEKLVQISNGRQ